MPSSAYEVSMILSNFFTALCIIVCGIARAGEANLIILIDTNNTESSITANSPIFTKLCQALLSAENPILVTPSLFNVWRTRAARFEYALRARQENKSIALDILLIESLKMTDPSLSETTITTAYGKYVDAILMADAAARKISASSSDRCDAYRNWLESQSTLNIPPAILDQAALDCLGYMIHPELSDFVGYEYRDTFLLFIPKKYLSEQRKRLEQHIVACGESLDTAQKDSFALGINLTGAKQLLRPPERYTWSTPQAAFPDNQAKKINFQTLFSLNRKHACLFPRLDIFINGHGSPAPALNQRGMIAGMPDYLFQQLLTALNNKTNARFVMLQSCYSGGENLGQMLATMTKSGTEIDLHFTLVTNAIADIASYSSQSHPVIKPRYPCVFPLNARLAIPVTSLALTDFFHNLNEWYDQKRIAPPFADELAKLLTVLIEGRIRRLSGSSLPNVGISWGRTRSLESLLAQYQKNNAQFEFDLPPEIFELLIAGSSSLDLFRRISHSQEPLPAIFKQLEKFLFTYAPAQQHLPSISQPSIVTIIDKLLGEGEKTAPKFYRIRFPHTPWFTAQDLSNTILTISNTTVRNAQAGGSEIGGKYRYTITYDTASKRVRVQRIFTLEKTAPSKPDVLQIPSTVQTVIFTTPYIPIILTIPDTIPDFYTALSSTKIGDAAYHHIDTIFAKNAPLTKLFKAFTIAIQHQLSAPKIFLIDQIHLKDGDYTDIIIHLDVGKKASLYYYNPQSSKYYGTENSILGKPLVVTPLSEQAKKRYTSLRKEVRTAIEQLQPEEPEQTPREIMEILKTGYQARRIQIELSLLSKAFADLEKALTKKK